MKVLLRVVEKQRSPIAYIGIQFQIQRISSVIYFVRAIHFKTIPRCQTKLFVKEKLLESVRDH